MTTEHAAHGIGVPQGTGFELAAGRAGPDHCGDDRNAIVVADDDAAGPDHAAFDRDAIQRGTVRPGRVDPKLIATIRGHHRRLQFFRKLKAKQYNALAAFLRLQMGWTPELPERERARINKRATTLIAAVDRERKGKDVIIEDPLADELALVIIQTLMGMDLSIDGCAEAEKAIEACAKQLPVWESWGRDVKGFGVRSLGEIVGVAGDLADYPAYNKLWKRFGVAVIDGRRQGAPGKDATKDDWIAHGYSPTRRAVLWNATNPAFQASHDRATYDRRRAHTAVTHPDWPKGHSDNDARRYLGKRLLRALWQAWRRAEPARL